MKNNKVSRVVKNNPYGLEQGTLYQRGYPHNGDDFGDSHWYEVENLICKVGAPNCNKKNVSRLLKLYPAPKACLTPGCRQQVKTGMKSWAFPVGRVEHYVCNNLVVNTTIEKLHILHPGIVIRSVNEKNGNIYVNTLGFGTGYLGKENNKRANETWGDVDNKIIFSIKVEK